MRRPRPVPKVAGGNDRARRRNGGGEDVFRVRDMRDVRPAVLLAAVPGPRVPRARGHVRRRDDLDGVPGVRPGAPAVLDVRAPRRLFCVIL